MATSSPARTATYLSSPGAQVYAGSPSGTTELPYAPLRGVDYAGPNSDTAEAAVT